MCSDVAFRLALLSRSQAPIEPQAKPQTPTFQIDVAPSSRTAPSPGPRDPSATPPQFRIIAAWRYSRRQRAPHSTSEGHTTSIQPWRCYIDPENKVTHQCDYPLCTERPMLDDMIGDCTLTDLQHQQPAAYPHKVQSAAVQFQLHKGRESGTQSPKESRRQDSQEEVGLDPSLTGTRAARAG